MMLICAALCFQLVFLLLQVRQLSKRIDNQHKQNVYVMEQIKSLWENNTANWNTINGIIKRELEREICER